MSIGRHAAWNVAGQAIPLLVALVAYPLLARWAGLERIGVMSLAWVLIGYLGLLDLGMGRVITRRIARAREQGRVAEEWRTTRASIGIVALLACLGSAIAWMIAIHGIDELNASPAIRQEARDALPWLVAGVLPIAIGGLLMGSLEGFSAFARVNAVRMALGVVGYLGPVVVAFLHPSLPAMIGVVTVTRWIAVVALVGIATATMLQFETGPGSSATRLSDVLHSVREGIWMALSNIVGPLLTMIDRFVIAIVISATATALYTLPFDMISKLLLVPAAVSSALFPVLARAEFDDAARTALLKAMAWAGALLAPVCTLIAGLAHFGLEHWMGTAFADGAHLSMRWLALAMLFGGLALIPYAALQAREHSRDTALLHLLELPFYLALLWYGVQWLGTTGAALACLIRMLADLLLMRAGTQRRLGLSLGSISAARLVMISAPVLIAIGLSGFTAQNAWIEWGTTLPLAALSALIVWRGLLIPAGCDTRAPVDLARRLIGLGPLT
ncbi:oligosaccharide flippase family protein [soil metagenome]